MPSFTVMPKEGLSLPRVSVSVFMIIRLLLLCITLVIMAVVGYYFSYYQGSFRNSLFHEELMLLVCSVAVFINSLIMIMSSMTLSRFTDGQVNLSSSYVEVIASAVNSFLLIISGIVLLIQVSVYGRYFVNHSEAKLFCGVLSLINGGFYILFSLFLFRRVQLNNV